MNTKEEIKKRIMENTRELFKKYGYKSLKVDMIANQLRISKRTIYELFNSKDTIIEESYQSLINEFMEELNNVALDMIKNENKQFFLSFSKIWNLTIEHATMFDENTEQEIKTHLPKFAEKCEKHKNRRNENFKTALEIGKKQGYIKENIDTDLFLSMMYFTMSNVLRNEQMINIPLKLNDAIKQIFDIFFTGAMTNNGAKYYKKFII